MELRVLRYFLAVAREGTISGAADFLHLSQPSLSRQLMALEKELGKALFLRGSRRIVLTEEGMLLRRRAEEIIGLVDKTESEFLDAHGGIGGDVHIGGGESCAMRSIAGLARELRREYPEIRFRLFSGNAEAVTDRLDKGLIDFGVLIDPAGLTKYDAMPLPDADVWGVLMRRDCPLAARGAVRPEDLWGLPLILSAQAMEGRELSNWLGREYEELNVAATYTLLYNASLLVGEGVGCALCLDGILNASGDSPFAFRPLKPKLEARLNVVRKKHQVFSRAARVFWERLQEKLRPSRSVMKGEDVESMP